MSKKPVSKRLLLSAAMIVLIPVVLVLGFVFELRVGIVCTAVIILSMLPFFLVFEKKGVNLRELVILSVMCAMAVIGRIAFEFVPQFKPILAIIIITAIALGPEAGFLCGSLSMLISNIFFGFYINAPWQMFCAGLIGLIAGALTKIRPLKFERRIILICAYGAVSAFIYGLIVDVSTILVLGDYSLSAILAVYAAAVYMNSILCAATVIFLALLAIPLIKILSRVKLKFGLMKESV